MSIDTAAGIIGVFLAFESFFSRAERIEIYGLIDENWRQIKSHIEYLKKEAKRGSLNKTAIDWFNKDNKKIKKKYWTNQYKGSYTCPNPHNQPVPAVRIQYNASFGELLKKANNDPDRYLTSDFKGKAEILYYGSFVKDIKNMIVETNSMITMAVGKLR